MYDVFMEIIITNFELIYKYGNYDRKNNLSGLTVEELMPIGIKWKYNGQEYKINNGKKLSAILLENNKNIAIVEEPYNNQLNKAYIINGNNTEKYNVKNLLNKIDLKTRSPYILGGNNFVRINKYGLLFDYPCYEGNELYFHISANNNEYRFLFDLETGKIGELIYSR